mgnify:FL=1
MNAFIIYDAVTPFAVRQSWGFEAKVKLHDVVIIGTYAYVVGEAAMIYVFDVSSQGLLAGTLFGVNVSSVFPSTDTWPAWAAPLCDVNTIANEPSTSFAMFSEQRVAVFSVAASPTAPALIGTRVKSGSWWSCAMLDDVIFATPFPDKFAVHTMNLLSTPTTTTTALPATTPTTIAPATPAATTSYQLASQPMFQYSCGDQARMMKLLDRDTVGLACDDNGFRILNVADPAKITVTLSVPVNGYVNDINRVAIGSGGAFYYVLPEWFSTSLLVFTEAGALTATLSTSGANTRCYRTAWQDGSSVVFMSCDSTLGVFSFAQPSMVSTSTTIVTSPTTSGSMSSPATSIASSSRSLASGMCVHFLSLVATLILLLF